MSDYLAAVQARSSILEHRSKRSSLNRPQASPRALTVRNPNRQRHPEPKEMGYDLEL